MRHYFFKNRIYTWPYEEAVNGFDFLNEAQEKFLQANPEAKLHEVRACMLDVNKPMDLETLKTSAKSKVDGMAAVRREVLMPAIKREAAIVVSQLGEDGAISMQVARDRLAYYNAVSIAIQTEKFRVTRLIDRAESKEDIDTALESCHIDTIKTGKERYE